MQQAIWLIDEGATPKTAAAALVIPLSALTKAVANRNTDQRLRASGIAPIIIEKLNEPLKRRLAQVTTDEGFVALTELVAAASLKSDVVYELVTNINEIRSSAKQVQFVELQKDVYLDDIQASGGGVITRRRFGAKQRIGMALGQVLNLPDEVSFVVTGDARLPDHSSSSYGTLGNRCSSPLPVLPWPAVNGRPRDIRAPWSPRNLPARTVPGRAPALTAPLTGPEGTTSGSNTHSVQEVWAWACEGFLGGLSPSTALAYGSDLRDLAGWAAPRGQATLELTRVDLDGYVRHLTLGRRLATPTVRRRLVAISRFFAWCVTEGLLTRSPATQLRRPRPVTTPPKVRLTTTEMAALLRAAEAHSDRAGLLVHLLLLQGARIGSVLGADVAQLRGPAGRRRLVLLTKGGMTQELLMGPATSMLATTMATGRRSGPLLPSATGASWHRTNASRLLRSVASTVLDEDTAQALHPHALRRAFVDASLDAGVGLPALKFALGHRSEGKVLRYAAEFAHSSTPVSERVEAALLRHRVRSTPPRQKGLSGPL